jgi:hypothetical protein
MILAHKTSAAVVQQPVNFYFAFQDPIGDAIRLQVIGLFLIHRDENRIAE